VSEHPGPPTLSLALQSVVDACMDAGARAGLLSAVAVVVPFPAPRRAPDDPDAA
jgi:hypothetical protein